MNKLEELSVLAIKIENCGQELHRLATLDLAPKIKVRAIILTISDLSLFKRQLERLL